MKSSPQGLTSVAENRPAVSRGPHPAAPMEETLRASANASQASTFDADTNHHAFSTVSHLTGDLESISFAAGLRGNDDPGVLEKLLPMLKIQPRLDQDARRKRPCKLYWECEEPHCVERESRIKKIQAQILKEETDLEALSKEEVHLKAQAERERQDFDQLEQDVDTLELQKLELDTSFEESQHELDLARTVADEVRKEIETLKEEAEKCKARLARAVAESKNSTAGEGGLERKSGTRQQKKGEPGGSVNLQQQAPFAITRSHDDVDEYLVRSLPPL